jgi:septum formation protein
LNGDRKVAKRFPFSSSEIILASSSPRRRYLLRLVRLKHVVVHPRVKEDDHVDSDPVRHVLQLSKLKARSVKEDFSRGYILGADTIVVLDGTILGKPVDRADARSMLGRLCGRFHEVYTGLTLVDAASGKELQGYERTRVKIRKMSGPEIDAYIETGEPMDKAGSYGIQGYGAAIVERVEGCYFNVVGLPVVRLLSLIRDMERICGGEQPCQ